MSKLGPKCQYFVWPPLFSSTALTLLGMEFTRASQIATGFFFHSSMTISRSWWMLETLRSSTFRLRMPYRCSIGALFLLWWLMRSNPVLLMNKAKALLYSVLLPLEGPIHLSHWLYQVSRECEDSSLSWSTLHTITSAL